uniref:Carbamoyl phosphate synthase small chain n=1 Tax=Herposiphonia versicolor TaxID=2007163 RepID=A0A1Z1MFU1_9FLOR|nr:carbamoyl phosphate synthase small subunit [Herposiphonia versicolor]ARW64685.1 carbamoyl phosphate synthase small subunit [Herposiphonia versicolor]
MSYTLYPSTLRLQDGTSYKGWSFFKLESCFGEIVFNTGMTGYQEIFSDPSYSGQMVVFTYPEIGNVGLNRIDNESNFIHVKAIVAKNISLYSSSWRSEVSLYDYIKQKKIPHIFGIDTRSLTRYIRLFGVTNAFLYYYCNSVEAKFLSLESLNNLDLIKKVTTLSSYSINSNFISKSNQFFSIGYILSKRNVLLKKYKILVFDLGIKFNIVRKLLLFDCIINIVPVTYRYELILQDKPDGILLSNGPGDPMLARYIINTVQKLIKFSNIPIFGICMGHQILNIAMGTNTFKLKFGHRGLNHPSGTNKYSEITSQNHGFAVSNNIATENDLLNKFSLNYLNLNDNTLSGTFHKKLPIFSVQYHPEANPGPHDSEYLFEVFINLIKLTKF